MPSVSQASDGETAKAAVADSIAAVGSAGVAPRSPVAPLLLGLALLFAAAAYASSLRAGFCFDDAFVVVRNATTQRLETLPNVFTESWWRKPGDELLWRPLASLSLGLQWIGLGGAPWHFHLVNLLLHLGVVALAARFLGRRLPVVAAGAAVLLWGVHPAPSEAVFFVVGRADLMAALFTLGALVVRNPWGRAVAVAAAMLSKELGLVAPLLVAVFDRLGPPPAERRPLDLPTALREWGPMGLAVVAVAAGKAAALGALYSPAAINPMSNPFAGLPLVERLPGVVALVGFAVGKLLFPASLAPTYYGAAFRLPDGPLDPRLLLGTAALGALGLLAARRPATRPWLLAAAVAWLPFSQLLQPIGVAVAERFLYLPSLFLLGALAAALPARLSPRTVVAAAAFAGVLLGARTFARGLDFRDERTLFAAAVRAQPESAMARFNHAQTLLDAGELDRAAAELAEAQRLAPDDRNVPRTLAGLQAGRGLPEEAWGAMERFLETHPADAAMLAAYREFRPPAARALPVWRRAAAAQPGDPGLALLAATAAFEAGENAEALDTLDRLAAKGDRGGEVALLGARAALALGEDGRAAEWMVAGAGAGGTIGEGEVGRLLVGLEPARASRIARDVEARGGGAIDLSCLRRDLLLREGRRGEAAEAARRCSARGGAANPNAGGGRP